MIPLRVLHALPDIRGAEWEALQALAVHLMADGHEHALLLPEGLTVPGSTCFPLVSVPVRWFPWWTRPEPAAVQAIAAWMPDLLHIHHPSCLALALPIARRLDLPVTCILHSPSQPWLLRRLRDPRIACTTVLGEHHRAGLIAGLGLSRNRVAVLPCGVHAPQAPTISPKTGPMTIGALGPDQPAAGLERLAQALARVTTAQRPLRLRLLPDPTHPESDREALTDLAHRHGNEVEISVATNTTSLSDFIDSIDGFAALAPDPHPWPLLTALARGRPALATVTGTAAELLPEDAALALLIAPDDDRALDEALTEIADPRHRQTAFEVGQSVVSGHCDAALVARAQAELWRTALNGGQHHGANELSSVWKRATASRMRRP